MISATISESILECQKTAYNLKGQGSILWFWLEINDF